VAAVAAATMTVAPAAAAAGGPQTQHTKHSCSSSSSVFDTVSSQQRQQPDQLQDRHAPQFQQHSAARPSAAAGRAMVAKHAAAGSGTSLAAATDAVKPLQEGGLMQRYFTARLTFHPCHTTDTFIWMEPPLCEKHERLMTLHKITSAPRY
jgi:hypothetical protein